MSIQGVFNTEVTKQTSLWVLNGMGAALSIYGLRAGMDIYRKDRVFRHYGRWIHKYTLLGGVIGAFITITVIQSMGALGPAKAAMLIVISQLIVAYVIELWECLEQCSNRLSGERLGMLIAIAGIVIFKWE